jgi:hypothetical protein
MKHLFLPILLVSILPRAHAQDCTLDKAFYYAEQAPQFNGSLKKYFVRQWKEKLHSMEGNDTLDILIDDHGKTCFIKTKGNLTGITPYDIRYAVANMPDWTPGLQNHYAIKFDARLAISCINGKLEVEYLNEKAAGHH